MSESPATKQERIAEAEIAAARMKSYTGSAVLVFVLYWLFWFPGLIVNFIFMQEAKRTEKIAGRSLPGTGCLVLMFWLNIIFMGLAVLFACAIGGFTLLTSM